MAPALLPAVRTEGCEDRLNGDRHTGHGEGVVALDGNAAGRGLPPMEHIALIGRSDQLDGAAHQGTGGVRSVDSAVIAGVDHDGIELPLGFGHIRIAGRLALLHGEIHLEDGLIRIKVLASKGGVGQGDGVVFLVVGIGLVEDVSYSVHEIERQLIRGIVQGPLAVGGAAGNGDGDGGLVAVGRPRAGAQHGAGQELGQIAPTCRSQNVTIGDDVRARVIERGDILYSTAQAADLLCLEGVVGAVVIVVGVVRDVDLPEGASAAKNAAPGHQHVGFARHLQEIHGGRAGVIVIIAGESRHRGDGFPAEGIAQGAVRVHLGDQDELPQLRVLSQGVVDVAGGVGIAVAQIFLVPSRTCAAVRSPT